MNSTSAADMSTHAVSPVFNESVLNGKLRTPYCD